MYTGLFAAASGMESQQNALDAVSNNLANIDTPGYQATELGFHDLLYTTAGPQNGTTVATGAGSASYTAGRDQTAGALQQTGRPLDVAVIGSGFFEVRRPDGTLGLTRNGVLELNANRQLTTQSGMTVMPGISIPSGVPLSQVTIRSDGTVLAAGKALGRISLVDVPAPGHLLNAGDSTFSASAASGPIRAATGTTLQQGALEASNVDMATEMTRMIDAQRSYQMDSRAIQMQDQMMQIANQIAK